MSLKEKALLVNISISQWAGRKDDHRATADVNKLHNTRNTGKFRKLLVDSPVLKEITTLKGTIRSFVYDNTMAWSDKGDRILPVENYLDFTNQLADLIDEYNQLADKFASKYADAIENAKLRLNGLFNPNDYPPTSDIRDKFGVSAAYQPLPDIKDFRLDLGEADVDEITKAVEQEIAKRHQGAVQDLFEKAKDAIQHIVTKLEDPNPKKRLHNSTFEKIEKMVNIFPKLNYTKDSKLARLTEEMKSLIIDADNLKRDEEAQEKYLERAKQLNELFF